MNCPPAIGVCGQRSGAPSTERRRAATWTVMGVLVVTGRQGEPHGGAAAAAHQRPPQHTSLAQDIASLSNVRYAVI